MVASVGIEPTTQGFSVLCSTDWATKPKKMAVPTRIELAIFCVTGRRDNRYTTGPSWLRGQDLNLRPSGYEPDELPNCSTPRYNSISTKIKMAEKEGFEPPRRRRPPGFQDRSLQPDLGISPFAFFRYELIITQFFPESQPFIITFIDNFINIISKLYLKKYE